MANYEYKEDELVLLNDKAVTYALSASKSTKYGVPTIPSHKLLKETYDALSTYGKGLSDFIEDVISNDLYSLSGKYETTKADVETSCDAISSLVSIVSTDLSTAISADVIDLKTNYVQLSAFKTTLIDNDGKLLSAEDFNLTYDATTHFITLKAGEKTYQFSSIDFIKSRTVHHLDIDRHDGKIWLKIFWTADDFIELDINEITQVYKFENGISSYIPSTGGILVGATDELARTAYADEISAKAVANAIAIEAESARAKAAEEANTTAIRNERIRAEAAESANAQAIAAETTRATAKEADILTALTAEETRAKAAEEALSAQCTNIVALLATETAERKTADDDLSSKTSTVSVNVQSIQHYVDSLSGIGPDIGIIATLSNDISSLQTNAVKELKFDGHIRIDSNLTARTIPDLFKQLHLGYDTNYVKNGSTYDITFDGIPTSCSYDLDVMKLGDGNYFIVHDHENKPFVKINDLNAENCYLIKAGVSRYVFETAYNWLSGETDRLYSEISDDVVAKYTWLSNSTVAVSNDIDGIGVVHQLSVVKISKSEYDELVATNGIALCGNVLYVVDSPYIDAYGQQLCNLTMSDDPNEAYLGVAATKQYVDQKLEEKANALQAQLDQIKTAFNATYANLSSITNDSQLSDLLSATVEIVKMLSCFQ